VPNSAGEPLAIVGIGCRLPGGIDDPANLWTALAEARDAIVEVPDTRWSASAFHHSDATVSGTSYSRWAGLVEPADEFDAAFFGITPREAQRIDPQQRWFLEATWRALEDAGQRVEDLRKQSVGVYVGCSSSDYGEIQRRWRYHADLHTNSGAAVSLLANRVSYAFDFRGPSLVVDTACSSSLVALDLAARAIRDGQCGSAIVGGANALFMPDATIGFSKAAMLARDGRCKAFDARADGYVRAEGAVALFLKPLERAVVEGDRLLGVISDGDLRRLLEQRGKDTLDLTAQDCMTRTPKTIGAQEFAATALARMEEMKITSLVVVDGDVDGDRRLRGIVHLHDLWGTEMV